MYNMMFLIAYISTKRQNWNKYEQFSIKSVENEAKLAGIHNYLEKKNHGFIFILLFDKI